MNSFRLGELFDPPAIVEQQVKKLPFKITVIGGAEEIKAWRKKHQTQFKELEASRALLELSQIDKIVGADAPIGEKNWDGKAELHEKSWQEKRNLALERRKAFHSRSIVVKELPPVVVEEPKKPGFMERIKKFVFKSLFS